MLFSDFLEEIKKTYIKHFPHSKCFVEIHKNLYYNISISCFLANDKSELISGYWENDMFSIKFSIDTPKGAFSKDIDLDSEVPDNLKLECQRKSYAIKPTESYMAYGRKKIPFRKIQGDYKKVLSTLDKFFLKYKNELLKDLDQNIIHDNYRKLLILKIK